MNHDLKELIKKFEKAEHDALSRSSDGLDQMIHAEFCHEVVWQLSEIRFLKNGDERKTIGDNALNAILDTSEENVLESCKQSLGDACSEASEIE